MVNIQHENFKKITIFLTILAIVIASVIVARHFVGKHFQRNFLNIHRRSNCGSCSIIQLFDSIETFGTALSKK